MPDDLYDRDSLAWSQRQAGLLRRHAAGERVNGIDWDHVVAEIEDVGLAQLNAVLSYLDLILLHGLKLNAWPEDPSCRHWRDQIVASQVRAGARLAPSMRQKIDLEERYQRASRLFAGLGYEAPPVRTAPAFCPAALDQLLSAPCGVLEALFRDAGG